MKKDRQWFYQVIEDWNSLPDFLEYFYNEYDQGREELILFGMIEKSAIKIGVCSENRFSQFQIVNAVVQHCNDKLDTKKAELYRKYAETYNRDLSTRDIGKYIETEPEVIMLKEIINQVALLRNLFSGLIKGFESNGFQIGHVSKLRIAGLDSAKFD